MDDMYDNPEARDYDDPVSLLPPLPDPLPGFDLPGPWNPRSSMVFLSSESKRVRIKTSEVTPALLGKVFSFSIFLISDSGQVVTADSEQNFDPAELEAEDWNCHGNSITPREVIRLILLLRIQKTDRKIEISSIATNNVESRKIQRESGHHTQNFHLPNRANPQVLCQNSFLNGIKLSKFLDIEIVRGKKTGNFPIRLKATVQSVGNIASQEAFGGKECVILDLDF